MALAEGQQRERGGDVADRDGHQRSGVRTQPGKCVAAQRDRDEHRGADGHARPRDHERLDAAVERDLDERVGHTPQDGDGQEQQALATGHPPTLTAW
jgi:hypothetical protein